MSGSGKPPSPGSLTLDRAVRLAHWGLPLLALLIWGLSLRQFDIRAMSDLGLISIFPFWQVAAYGLLILSFGLLFLQRRVHEAAFFLHCLVLVVMVHATPQLLYGTLRYSWAWKHVGLVDYIQRHGQVNPQIHTLGIYHNWPSFFALNAMLADIVRLPEIFTLAGYAPVFFEILFLMALIGLFRRFTADRRLQWLAIWFFLLSNWIAQDYFSPQAFNFFLYLIFIWMVLAWFGTGRRIVVNNWRWLRPARPRVPYSSSDLLVPISSDNQPRSRREEIGAAVAILLLFLTIVSSHQLTPVMAIAAVGVLVGFKLCRWRLLPLWMALMMLGWLFGPASTFNTKIFSDLFETIGNIFNNVDASLINVAQVNPDQAIVTWMGRGLSALMVLLAGLGFLRRIRRGYLDLAAMTLVISPLMVLVASSYGGEALFRVYMFALPFFAFFAAGLVLADGWSAGTASSSIVITALSAVMTVGLIFSYYGKENHYYFTPEEVEAATYLYSHAGPNTLLVEGARNYPSQFKNYEYFTYVLIDREPLDPEEGILEDPVGKFAGWLANSRYDEGYIIITRGQKNYVNAVGTLPHGALERVEAALRESELFEIYYANRDAVIFRLREKP